MLNNRVCRLNYKECLMKLLAIIICLVSLNIHNVDANASQPSKMSFWNSAQKGANIFNKSVTREDIRAAKAYGIAFIRLAPDKFSTKTRDFLIGNADHFDHLVLEDLAKLKEVLDICAEENMPVVLTLLSLPGSRWKQNNNDQDDLRIWKSPEFRQEAAKLWKELATELKDHQAIVGYNILNEPHPERLYSYTGDSWHEVKQEDVQGMLFTFYDVAIASIRSVDQETPIILDSTAHADPRTFNLMKAHADKNVLYSFHMYEPYVYTNKKLNKGYTYPGRVDKTECNKTVLKAYMQAVADFQKDNNIPSNRILVGEFGCNREAKGLPAYFQDLISIFNENGWHYAFYAFREDTWPGMDYELGSQKLPWTYWEAVDKGETPKLERKSSHPAFQVLIKGL
jgi:endoglucanase